MRKSQDIKLKNGAKAKGSIPIGSGILLLLLAVGLVCPIAPMGVWAEEDVVLGKDTVEDESENDAAVPVAQADSVNSTVGFAFGEPVGVTSLTPTAADGASAQYSIQATVSVENSGGYTVYLGSKNSSLTGKASGATINTVTSSTTYENLPNNSWGYSVAEGTTVGSMIQAMPTNNRGNKIGENTSKTIKSDSKTFTLAFAAHIGNDKPADTYENKVTMSVVSNPIETVLNDFGVSTMQEMTPTICASATDADSDGVISARLQDVRDDRYYWIARLADGNCWMTQNLDLDLGTSWPDAATSDYTIVNTSYQPVATASTATTATVNSSATSTRSWSLGEYVITNPTSYSDCGNPRNSFASCPSQFTAVGSRVPSTDPNFYAKNGNKTFTDAEYDAHYLVGNFYQWNTATAGTGGTITTGQASGSICPKGWRLPISNTTAARSFGGLLSAASIGTSVSKLTSNPFYFVRGGMVDSSPGYLFSHAGTYGLYWSSTPNANNKENAYRLSFNSSNGVNYSENAARSYGHSVRCVAR